MKPAAEGKWFVHTGKRTSKMKAPRLTSVVRHSCTGAVNATMSSTIPHNHPKRNRMKVSVRNAPQITTQSQEQTLTSCNLEADLLNHCELEEPDHLNNRDQRISSHCTTSHKGSLPSTPVRLDTFQMHDFRQQHEKSLPMRSVMHTHNDAVLLSNNNPHSIHMHHETRKVIRYSRRMPIFPSVSSSHVYAQPATLNQPRNIQVREGRTKANDTSLRHSVKLKGLTHSPRISLVLLKLPSIMK